MDKLHTCTQANPMRINSDPEQWQHPDSVLVGEPWWTFGNPDKAEEVECRYRECRGANTRSSSGRGRCARGR